MNLNEQELGQIAAAWIGLHHASEKSPEWAGFFWAFDRVCDLVQDDPESAWEVIGAIRQRDGSDLILSNLAAGPLEDLLVTHGENFITRIEEKAKSDDQLRRLLGGIWQNDMPDALWTRIKAIAVPSW
jgi:hypothetical protein